MIAVPAGKRDRVPLFASLLLLTLAACSAFSSADPALQKNPDFRAGYDDGCAAASTAGANPRQGPFRDEALYDSDEAYRAGWGNGYATCRNGVGNSQPYTPLSNQLPGQH